MQPGRPKIQGELAAAVERVCGEHVLPHGSGRTDAGVHALAQIASFNLESAIPTDRLRFAMNNTLPAAVRVLEIEEAREEFHARRSAQYKTYRYRISRREITSPFLVRYLWHYPYPLHETEMITAASLIEGEHDFTAFAAADAERGTEQRSAVRRIFSSVWRREGDELVYEVSGNGFLHHMVRNIVGTFVMVGKGTITPAGLVAVLSSRDRSRAGPTAPPQGLCLVSVGY
ncbi:MAG: tRNA pseudouridine(38-40) synthase TruA [Acidobacteriaceae bacterium]